MNQVKIKKVFDTIGIEINFMKVKLDLPISYQKRYSYQKIKIDKMVEMLFILEKRQGSFESFINQAEKMSGLLKLPYVLVFTSLSFEKRNLLLKARIPFLDYKGEIFLPQLGMILHKETKILNFEKFISSEQRLFIYILLFMNKEFSVVELTTKINMTTPTVYRMLKKFVNYGWISSSHGTYQLIKSKKEIFKEAENLFINPIKKTIYIDETEMSKLEEVNIKKAGEMALSELTMLNEEEHIYAISNEKSTTGMSEKEVVYFDENIIRGLGIQLWKYEPISYLKDNVVDPISLYFSFSKVTDPRIEQELGILKNQINKILEE